jgi:serine/threonine protein kinase
MTNSPIQFGEVLAGKYRVGEVLGSGGMGVVHSATHVQLGSRVAIKFLLPTALKSEAAAARLLREARATAKIESDHVARVIDVGTLANGAPYIVMEYLAGKNFSALMRERERFPFREAVAYVLQACEGIAQAHGLGIIHRDLKTSNLFLTRRADGTDCVKVLDFGLSKVSMGVGFSMDAHLTATADVFGSPVYMSPEQLRSARDVDARTDIWALGTILFELIAGRPPFKAATLPQVCTLVLHARPPSLREFSSDVPAELEAVLGRCLEKEREKRVATVQELAQLLAPFAEGPLPGSLRSLVNPILPANATPLERSPNVGPNPHRKLLFVAGLTFSLGLGVGAWKLLRSALFHGAEHTMDSQSDAMACADLGTSACSACLAANCCGEYRKCQTDTGCSAALQSFNRCRDQANDHGAAAACSEKVGTDPNPLVQNLASCAFVRIGGPVVAPGKCAQQCNESASQNACMGYCSCMKEWCQMTMAPDACPAACARMTPEQVRCRTYHCFLGGKANPEIHCQHAIGGLGTCP